MIRLRNGPVRSGPSLYGTGPSGLWSQGLKDQTGPDQIRSGPVPQLGCQALRECQAIFRLAILGRYI